MSTRINADGPLWDQSTFGGRFRHFLWVTDPRTCFTSERTLRQAKILVEQYRVRAEPPGTTLEQVIYAKKLCESAFHPDSGELQHVFGRMSFQIPGGMIIGGCMLQFYRTIRAVIFWQWVNQSFNALVNYTNRNGQSPITTTQIAVAYVSATAAAMMASLGFMNIIQHKASPLLQRYVPFAAVCASSCVNVPLMRQAEIINGIDVEDEKGKIACRSKIAAVKGISQVVISRIVLAAPPLLLLPAIMEYLEKKPCMRRNKPFHGPIQAVFAGCFLTFMVPTALALYPQKCSIYTGTVTRHEPEEFKKIMKISGRHDIPLRLYFNKGL